ncbi:hypothetical protein TBLA_0C03330 [Henningerozyma blattae CBS 6284]|uniref:Protein transport protein SEC23 n=1 Tax=Henningerozyma blattae (strain ATCC 34711 / CBS 6284 / DSM 70876 / NBRC 10599 / NRRL Y-10934 / UCD 77-7) TaxID=1071380 RepID=I2H184_HENB6|nr:hypothetical protein TBLA_0C03330 [Tetrapisispora blattae CBS 6284]CCH60136.1 hypothetical protein TBLA_0C03330 [Tetrapisispora blattae CBS 6284]
MSYDSSKNIHCIFQPFIKEEDDFIEKTSFAIIKCENCSSTFHNFQNIEGTSHQYNWVCEFCQSKNSIGTEAKLQDLNLPNSYTAELVSRSKTNSTHIREKRSIFVIDCLTNEIELETLKLVLNNPEALPEGKYALITIEPKGNVVINLSSGKTVPFSIEQSKIEKAVKNLDDEFFLKHITVGAAWFDSKITFTRKIKTLKPFAKKETARAKKRPKRATGLALFLASVLSPHKNCNTHIMSFLSGPCTIGPGKVASTDIKKPIRSHDQLDSGRDKYFIKTTTFYEEFNAYCLDNICFDFFISSLDQTGLLEWKSLLTSSMSITQFDSFNDEKFTESWRNYIKLRNEFALELASLKILSTSGIVFKNNLIADIKFQPTKTKNERINEMKWKFNKPLVLNPKNFVIPCEFEVHSGTLQTIQFQLHYYKDDQSYIKIVTIPFKLIQPWKNGFHIEIEIPFLLKKFAQQILLKTIYDTSTMSEYLAAEIDMYEKNLPTLSDRDLKLFYQLQRSTILLKRNTSPDEHILLAHYLYNSSTSNCLFTCNPLMIKFPNDKSIKGKTDLIPLDARFATDSHSLFVDGGVFIMVRYTEETDDTVKAKDMAMTIIKSVERYPKPRFIYTMVGKSQDRFFKSKLIPLTEEESVELGTQDLPFEKFTQHVHK